MTTLLCCSEVLSPETALFEYRHRVPHLCIPGSPERAPSSRRREFVASFRRGAAPASPPPILSFLQRLNATDAVAAQRARAAQVVGHLFHAVRCDVLPGPGGRHCSEILIDTLPTSPPEAQLVLRDVALFHRHLAEHRHARAWRTRVDPLAADLRGRERVRLELLDARPRAIELLQKYLVKCVTHHGQARAERIRVPQAGPHRPPEHLAQ